MIRIWVLVIFVGSLILAPLCEAKIVFPFEGLADVNRKELNLTVFPGGPRQLALSITPASQNQYQIKIKTEHWATPFFEISTELTGVIEIVMENKSSPTLIGKVSSQYSLINFKPADETTGGFEIRNGVLTINTLSIGSIHCEGTLGLAAPYPVNMTVHFDEIHLKDFIDFFAGEQKFPAEGQVAGDINITGSAKELQLKGNLASYHGMVKGFDFDHMILNLVGTYPMIQVIESDIAQTDGLPFQVKGIVDLSDKENFDKQIQALAREPFVADDRTSREWTLKRTRSDAQNSKTEVKYLLRKDAAQSTTEKDGMIGVTRTVEF